MNVGQFGPSCDLHKQFIEAFGEDAIQTIGAIVAWAHIRAPRAATEQWGEVGLDRSGLIRWIQIDHDLVELDGRFPNVRIGLFNNDSGGMKHVEVSAGRFRLLFAHDADPRTQVPISDYAKRLARRNQWTLFGDQSDADDNLADHIYAVLFHAKSDTKGEVPAFLEVRFPDGENSYATEHLRLYAKFPNLRDEGWLLRASLDFAAAIAPREEKIREEAMPKFRRSAETGTA